MRRFLASLLAGSLVLGWAGTAWSADKVANDERTSDKILVATSFRTSALTGLNVRNAQGEKLGKINDLVIDIRSGKIAYAALSMGGVFGIGDKLFAVPYADLKFDHGANEMFFVLNMSKEKLQAAPGFDKSNWPNFADPNWS